MDYVEKRKQGRKRILEKKLKENEKKKRIEENRSYSVAIKNEKVFNSIYTGLNLNEKKLYRYILSRIKKGDDVDTTFIIRHKDIQELFNDTSYTSKKIPDKLIKISSSLTLIGTYKNGKKRYITIPIFKTIDTSEDSETTNIIFNEKYTEFAFFCFDKGHFLKYELASILNYKNLHTIELFENLLAKVRENQREEIVSIVYDIEELKEILDCKKQETKDFIKQVIKKSVEEINKYNKNVLGGTIDYKYNRTKKTITFYIENISYMLKQEKKSLTALFRT